GRLGRQREQTLPAVGRRGGLDHEAAVVEAAQDAAEIAVIETERAGERGRCRLVAGGELVQHARFRQRIGAVQEAVLQDADLLGVKAVETANGADALLGEIDCGCRGHGQPPTIKCDTINKLFDYVKYLIWPSETTLRRCATAPAGGRAGGRDRARARPRRDDRPARHTAFCPSPPPGP